MNEYLAEDNMYIDIYIIILKKIRFCSKPFYEGFTDDIIIFDG